jgi:pyruvate,water dikinase
VAASSGVVRAKARIVRSEAEWHTLQPGEVLVCPFTNPAWTPLFAVAAAVVTETGGAGAHAAIVAREYGIPAVMGVAGATSLIADGQEILVDGSAGRVVV